MDLKVSRVDKAQFLPKQKREGRITLNGPSAPSLNMREPDCDAPFHLVAVPITPT